MKKDHSYICDIDGVADHLSGISSVEKPAHREADITTSLSTPKKCSPGFAPTASRYPYICDVGISSKAMTKQILFEAQLGALRDIDYGIYPYTSSSNSIAAFSTIGAGIPQLHLDESIGVMKAYSTCVGEGPFVCELFGEEGEILRRAGNEYGAATGRPRRVGGFDVGLALRSACQGATKSR